MKTLNEYINESFISNFFDRLKSIFTGKISKEKQELIDRITEERIKYLAQQKDMLYNAIHGKKMYYRNKSEDAFRRGTYDFGYGTILKFNYNISDSTDEICDKLLNKNDLSFIEKKYGDQKYSKYYILNQCKESDIMNAYSVSENNLWAYLNFGEEHKYVKCIGEYYVKGNKWTKIDNISCPLIYMFDLDSIELVEDTTEFRKHVTDFQTLYKIGYVYEF